MVASAPSPAAEWLPPQRVQTALRRHRVRALGFAGPRALLVGDLAVAVTAALALRPLGTVADMALVGAWVGLLAPSRGRARGASSVGARPVNAALHAGLVLAFLGLVLASVARLEFRPAALAAYVGAVAAGAALHRGCATALGRSARSHSIPVVLAGHGHGVRRLVEELRTADGPFTVAAVCLAGRASATDLGVPVVRGLDNLAAGVAEHGAEAVIAVPCRHLDPCRLRRLAWCLEAGGTALFVGTGLRELGPGRARIGVAGTLPVIHVRHAALGGASRVVKQVWERSAAALALVLFAPLLLLLALAVRLDSPGSALFRQTRVGRDGRHFTMLKLRTMGVDAEQRLAALAAERAGEGVLFKMSVDPRVTRVGRVLRRYSLDELPQLVNVVRGEMALVGPRPPLPREVDQYEDDTRRRLVVAPGLTGLWQVSGRSDLDWEQSVRLDLWYVENWSLGLDLHIVLRTVRAVLGHRGAY